MKGHTLQGMLNRPRLPALTAQTSMPVDILKIIGNKKDTYEVAFNGTEFLSSLDNTVKVDTIVYTKQLMIPSTLELLVQ